MKKLLLTFCLALSAQTFAQNLDIGQHCNYLSKSDPKACASSSFCKIEKKSLGVCKSNKQEQIFSDICDAQSSFPDMCKQNSAAGCYFETAPKYSCSPKM